MKKIIISCPYNSLDFLKKELLNSSNMSDLVISSDDISAIDDDFVYLKHNGEKHEVNSFTASFIRYPYDLIDPHTESYQKREHTEFLKTLGLVFEDVAINSISKAHFIRNRFYSMKLARESGFETPNSTILKDSRIPVDLSQALLSKSLGNCYFSEKISERDKMKLESILTLEEDDGEKAYIYNPHNISKDDVKDHLKLFETCLVQEKIEGTEYRVFVVDDQVFCYLREEINSTDKSSASLIIVDTDDPILDFIEKFIVFRKKIGIGYLCLDIILKDIPVVIDVNPFGSFPKGHREVEIALSKLLLQI